MISGQTIKETRVQKLVPQHALAKQLGVSQQMVTYWEKQPYIPNGKKILAAIEEVERNGIFSFKVHKTRV